MAFCKWSRYFILFQEEITYWLLSYIVLISSTSYSRVLLIFADSGKVDLVMNLVERPSGGFSAGGGISSG